MAELVLDPLLGTRHGRLRPRCLFRFRQIHTRRRHRLRVLVPVPPQVPLLPLGNRGTSFEGKWGSGGACLDQVVPIANRIRARLQPAVGCAKIREELVFTGRRPCTSAVRASEPGEKRMIRRLLLFLMVLGLVPVGVYAGEEANAPTVTGETGLF